MKSQEAKEDDAGVGAGNAFGGREEKSRPRNRLQYVGNGYPYKTRTSTDVAVVHRDAGIRNPAPRGIWTRCFLSSDA